MDATLGLQSLLCTPDNSRIHPPSPPEHPAAANNVGTETLCPHLRTPELAEAGVLAATPMWVVSGYQTL
jgi:hypothetical protein